MTQRFSQKRLTIFPPSAQGGLYPQSFCNQSMLLSKVCNSVNLKDNFIWKVFASKFIWLHCDRMQKRLHVSG